MRFEPNDHRHPVPMSLPPDVAESLSAVLDELWDGEREHFRGRPAAGHLFRHLVAIDQWMSGHRLPPEHFVADYRG